MIFVFVGLLTPCTMDKICPGAVECAFRLELNYCSVQNASVQLGIPLNTPFLSSENLFVPSACNGRFITGTLYGNNHPHVLLTASDMSAEQGNARDVKAESVLAEIQPFCRRFAVDLACPSGLEFVEVSWLSDGRVLVQTNLIKDHGVAETTVFVFGHSAAGFLSSNIQRVCKVRDAAMCCAACSKSRRICSCEMSADLVRGSDKTFVPVRSWWSWTRQLEALRSTTSLLETQRFDMSTGAFMSPQYVYLESRPCTKKTSDLDRLMQEYVADLLSRHGAPLLLRDQQLLFQALQCKDIDNSVCKQEVDLQLLDASMKKVSIVSNKHRASEYDDDDSEDLEHRSKHPHRSLLKSESIEETAAACSTQKNGTSESDASAVIDDNYILDELLSMDAPLLIESMEDGLAEFSNPESQVWAMHPNADDMTNFVELESEPDVLNVSNRSRLSNQSGRSLPSSSDHSSEFRQRTGTAEVSDGPRQHSCPHCSAMFSTSSNMRKHVRAVHLREKKYVCEFCGNAFAQSTDRNRHTKSKHPDSSASNSPEQESH